MLETQAGTEMSTIDAALDDAIRNLSTLEFGTDAYERGAKAVEHLASVGLDDFRAAVDREDKEERRRLEAEARAQELESQEKQRQLELIKLGMQVVGFAVGTAIYVFLYKQALNVEVTGTLATKSFSELRRANNMPSAKFV